MKRDDTKKRYIKIEGNGLPFMVCEPHQVHDSLLDFFGTEITEPVTITDAWMTDAEFDALPEWEG